MANGNDLSFALFRQHSDLCERLLYWFAPPLLYRLTISPNDRNDEISSCEIRVSHIRRPGTEAEQLSIVNCDWSLWESLDIRTPEVCEDAIENEEITEKAAIGLMALLIARLENITIERVTRRGTGADYLVRAIVDGTILPVEVSGIEIARYPSEARSRVDQKRNRLLGHNSDGFVSVTAFSHPPNRREFSYLHFVMQQHNSNGSNRINARVTSSLTPDQEASLLSLEGETALYEADNILARDKHAQAAKILKRHWGSVRTSTDRHMRLFEIATQYYKAGLYFRSQKFSRRVQAKFLRQNDKKLFQVFSNEINRRVKPMYSITIQNLVQECQSKDDFKKVAALIRKHPFVYNRIAMAFMWAYSSMRSKKYAASGTFANASCRFGLDASKVVALAFLPCVVELKEGRDEGCIAAQRFAKHFPHPMAYLVAASILYRVANSKSGEDRRRWAQKQITYYEKGYERGIAGFVDLPAEYQNDMDIRFFLFTSSATAAIAYSWLRQSDKAHKCLESMELFRSHYRDHRDLAQGIRRLVESSETQDVIEEELTVPLGNLERNAEDSVRTNAGQFATPVSAA